MRRCKRKPDDVYDGALESHVNELRKHQSETDLCVDQAICDIHYLFNTTESKSDNKLSTGTGRKENKPERTRSKTLAESDCAAAGEDRDSSQTRNTRTPDRPVTRTMAGCLIKVPSRFRDWP